MSVAYDQDTDSAPLAFAGLWTLLPVPNGDEIDLLYLFMEATGVHEKQIECSAWLLQYDPRFADPFWNSSQQSMVQHLMNILTSWALVCEVWYLPPTRMQVEDYLLCACILYWNSDVLVQEGEDSAMFARRVQRDIATTIALANKEEW